jgi:predicted Zn-dependent protease
MIRALAFALALCLALPLSATFANAAAIKKNMVAAQELRLKAIGERIAMANAAYCPIGEQIPAANGTQPRCVSLFWVDPKSTKDAGADGERVRVTSGLIAFLVNDDELAAVAAHELAHNQLGHPALLDGLKKGRAKALRTTEIEADQLAIWLLANAGYDPRAAVRMWQRLGPRFSKTPRLAERLTFIEREIAMRDAAAPKGGRHRPPQLTAESRE